MMKKRKRLWALLLAAVLLITQLPGVVLAEDKTPQDGSIASFEELAGDVERQEWPVGTSYEELNLPDKVTAEVYRVERKTPILSENEAGGQ